MKKSRPETADAKLQIALRDFRSGNDASALSLLTPLADEGNARAQYWLADMYEDDDSGVKPDLAKAQALLEKSAAQGFAPAERRLGQLYLRGTTTLQDFGKAQTWLHKAATAGDARAQEQLGHIYALGSAARKTGSRPTAGMKMRRFMATVWPSACATTCSSACLRQKSTRASKPPKISLQASSRSDHNLGTPTFEAGPDAVGVGA